MIHQPSCPTADFASMAIPGGYPGNGDEAPPATHLVVQPTSPRRLDVPRFDPEQTRTYLGYVMEPGSVNEIRVMGARFGNGGFLEPTERFASTFSGYLNDIDAAVAEAGKLWGVSGYFMPNPVNPSLLARSANRITKQRTTATDDDVAEVRWIYVDIDAVRPAGISSTGEELAAAVSVRDRILAKEPELEAAAIWGISGNGAWVLVRIDPISPAESPALASKALAYLAAKYNVPGKVEIDPATRNPSRIACLPGTLKCKGDEVPGRPHRLVTIENGPRKALKPIALPGWVAAHPLPVEANAGQGGLSASHGKPSPGPALRGADVTIRATAYLDKMAPAIQGQNGSAQCFDAACAIVKGFGLTIEQALPLLQQWNARCVPPWSEAELLHKLKDATERPGPVGYLLNARPLPGLPSPSPSYPAGGLPDVEGEPDDAAGREDDRHRLAELALDGYRHADHSRLVYWRDEFWTWENGHYSVTPEKELLAQVSSVVGREFDRIYGIHMQRYAAAVEAAATGEGKPPRRPRKLSVTRSIVADVVAVLREKTVEPIRDTPDQPAWIGGECPWLPAEVIPAANALVHLPSLAVGLPCTTEPTPSYFCGYSLGYDFDEDAPEPTEWLKFLKSLWPYDPEAIEAMQMWFGYLITPDTSQQKIGMLIGPPRCGKGTIIDVLRGLLGPFNVVAPTLSQLASQFGAAPMVGKPLAVITDCRLDGHTSKAAIVERLLSISGEDPQTIDRKYREPITVKLPTRIMIVSNEVPALRDSSGALASRFIVHEFTRSFAGREDTTLKARLQPELSGILQWAIRGWQMLHERGGLEQHATPGNIVQQIQDQTSPVKRFIGEECAFDSGGWIFKDDLHAAYLAWCGGANTLACDKIEFGRRLTAAISADGYRLGESKRINGSGRYSPTYAGIRLRVAADLDDEPPF